MTARVPYPRTETWFIGVEPLADAGECESCGRERASVVVDGEHYVCADPNCVQSTALAAADQHGLGYIVPIEYTETPGLHMPPAMFVDLPEAVS